MHDTKWTYPYDKPATTSDETIITSDGRQVTKWVPLLVMRDTKNDLVITLGSLDGPSFGMSVRYVLLRG